MEEYIFGFIVGVIAAYLIWGNNYDNRSKKERIKEIWEEPGE